MTSPLFGTGLARSGGRLYSSLLSVNPHLTMAVCPYIELFRSLRNAMIRAYAPDDVRQAFDPRSPVQDYYFTDLRIRTMDAIQASSLRCPFDPAEREVLLERVASRAVLEAGELVPYLGELVGSDYKEVFDRALWIIGKARGAERRKWVGFHEVWNIEFFRPLAGAYPDARFIVMLRDPRAIVASMLGVGSLDPSQIAQTLSYARHWRKYAAFVIHYRNDPLFRDRLFVMTHERLVRQPEAAVRELCDFLEVRHDPAMLDTSNYVDHSTGRTWSGNSSFEAVTAGISLHRAERWREVLEPRIARTIEFLCGPDMAAMGYEVGTDGAPPAVAPEVVSYLAQDHRSPVNWRSDLGDLQEDLGAELFRRAILDAGCVDLDARALRRSFLFEDVHAVLARATAGVAA